ncbi:unnamed protein product [Hermetia illucens]|uniref:CAP-Gly domain-containing protein n=1 Tax=Hermetia illucens TaxID=343691 RepID=A0A7R8V228_HERIL|nr:tubulin-folding cofactor B [Hermetia illucens]CAD7091198.1 unnamed protein product [Hermetia illucens]
MGDQITLGASDFVKVNITNSKTESVVFEKKFPKDISVADLKNKLEILTGGCAATMQVELYNGDNLVCKLDNNDALVGSFPIEDGMRFHVIDNFQLFTETVEKFDLTEEQYNQKEDSLRSFLKKNKLGKYNEEEMKKIEEKRREAAEEEARKAAECKVGLRCQVTTKNQPRRRGVIMFNGEVEGKKGVLIGVKFDEPLGVNDGSLEGKRYFECEPKYGSFVTPAAVEVGDFPPEETGLEDEI